MQIIVVMIALLSHTASCFLQKKVPQIPQSARNRLLLNRALSVDHQPIRKRIVFLGTPQVAAESLQMIANASKENQSSSFEIVAVVSQPPAGLKKVPPPSPVHALALKLQIPVLTPTSAKDEQFLSEFEALNVDMCITAAYGNYLPKKFLSVPKFGTVNIHPSVLPLYRGAAPVQRCLEHGDTSTGVSVLFTVSKMDAGPIIARVPYPLTGQEKAPEVLSACFRLGTRALLEALPAIFDGTVVTSAQDDAAATHAPKLTVQDAEIDFQAMGATGIHNKVRGFAEWPGTIATLQLGTGVSRVKIITTYIIDPTPGAADPSQEVTVVKLPVPGGKKKPVDMLRVVCGDGSVLGILEVIPSQRNKMDIKALVNGIQGVQGNRTMRWVQSTSVPTN